MPVPEPNTAGSVTPGLTAEQVDERINAALARQNRVELPKAIKAAMTELMPDLSNAFLERFAQELPSDEEIARMEQEEADAAAAAGEGGEGGGEAGAGTGDAGDGLPLPPQWNARFRQMERIIEQQNQKLEELTGQNEEAYAAAEEADRVAQVQSVLNSYTFRNDASRDVAARYLLTNAYRNEEGELVAGPDNAPVPLKDFATETMTNLDGLLQPRAVGGAGAFQGAPGSGKTKPPSIEDIKPGMPRDERVRIMQHAVSQLPSASGSPDAGVNQ